MFKVRIKRGTRAQLDAAVIAGSLIEGEPYLITDESRIAVGTGPNTFMAMSKQGESSSGGIPAGPGAAGISWYPYASRADLRSDTTASYAVVDSLGLFAWYAGSTEPDDDETCFAATGGRWLLQAPHWDTIDRFFYPEIAAIHARFLHGAATCAIATVAAANSTTFNGVINGAAVGDNVIVTPPASLGSTTAHTGRLGFYGYVSAANTVTVVITNASAAVATLNAGVQGAWSITVVKA